MAKLTITGAKAIINESIFRAKCEEHAESMEANAIKKAPEDTGLLKSEGIKKETVSDGARVYLDTKAVHYGPYQELGWEQKRRYPGKFFMESSFELECAKAGVEAKSLMKDALTIISSNGYDIVEYRTVGGSVSKGAYKK